MLSLYICRHKYTHTQNQESSILCTGLYSLLWHAAAPYWVLYDNVRVSWDFAMLSLCHYYTPCYSPSSLLLSLCVTVCLCLSSYTSHCIWPCWLSHILHCVSAALEVACSQTVWGGKKEALQLPNVPLYSRWYIKRPVM